ncbi:MAG: heat-inducible transcription repressor HrcA [Clostridia bacterium]|nr:heat-inducible transcription repressor HrcA [Clostridia bacterium]
MSELSERKKLILSAVVEQYIKSGEPVGSKELIALTGMSVSSATVRNEMSELSSMGYLEQPHTSAGRIPSQKGYRYYVDNLMKDREIDELNRRMIEAGISSAAGDPERLIAQAGEVLAELTKCACVSTAPGGDTVIIRKIELVPVGIHSAMLVLLTSNGILKSRLCRLDCELTAKILEEFYNIVDSCIIGKPASDISVVSMQTAAASVDSDPFAMLPLMAAVCELARSMEDSRIILGGSSNLFSHKDYGVGAIELFEFLNKREPLSAVISGIKEPLDIIIGKENLYRQLENSSVIVAKYSVGGRDSGSIGLIGPTRMDYESIIPSVKYLTDIVGKMITQAIEE